VPYYTLKIYARTRRAAIAGALKKQIDIDATDDAAAEADALTELATVNWDEEFAALEASEGKFFRMWDHHP
jgi:hypothetical protein